MVIIGCGYTGVRVARMLLADGHDVLATSRSPERLQALGIEALHFDVEQPDSLPAIASAINHLTRVLISIPTVADEGSTARLIDTVGPHAKRLVYLSTTGVYGSQQRVDETTPVAPQTARERLRVAAENGVAMASNHMILRPAAIYGPHRGIHTSMRAGKYSMAGDGSNFVSRIHVDDLAQLCVKALLSDVTGAWPVADDEPCTSREIAEFCSELLAVPMPESEPPEAVGETRRADRRVDGSAIRRELRVELRYPSYRVGIPACVAAEAIPERAF